ncbi:MAG: hypothetical protein ABIO99_02795 [Candidatus Limnocylindria bacterium]
MCATADRIRSAAETARGKGRQDAAATVMGTIDEETSARDRHHEAERKARSRRGGGKP